jgi:site-specific recombinase XerD
MNDVLKSYLADLAARGFSRSLRENTIYAVDKLAVYLGEHYSVESWREVRAEHLDGFALFLRRDHRTRQNLPLKESTVSLILSKVSAFFEWQERRGHLLWNPAADLIRVKPPPSLPRVLNERDMTRLIETPDTTKAVGLRDRALMEMLYATGIRHAEAHRLELYDVDAATRRLTVREGKGGRDRIVPLTENAAFWLTKYLSKSRSELARRAHKAGQPPPAPSIALWLSNSGRRLPYSSIDHSIAKYAAEANVNACVHTFRHSCASHLLRGGADIRHIQKLLGHRTLLSTQIYLHLDVEDLKRSVTRLRKSLPEN